MLPDWDLTLRLLIAAALGSVIGIERERLAWAAGLRTHMLVSVGSCLAMIVSAYGFSGVLGRNVVLDPSRVAAQVISGVGFLGAGSIILRNEVVKGLTTAASLWAVAAVGLAVGGGLYMAAVAATVIILIILAGIKPLEERFRNSRQTVELHLNAPRGAVSIGLIEQALGWRAPQVKRLIIQAGESAELDDVTVTLAKVSPREVPDMIRSLAKLPSVTDVREANA
jgi:putative Mg2+ transporter-C (MgtC) family protein